MPARVGEPAVHVAGLVVQAKRRQAPLSDTGALPQMLRVSDQRTVTLKTTEAVSPLMMRRSFLPFRPSLMPSE